MYKVVFVTPGQPALNPRLVKEAETLVRLGWNVTVIYAYWNDWGKHFTEELIRSSSWNAVCAGGDPETQPLTFLFSRLLFRLSRLLLAKTGNFTTFGPLAIARSAFFLRRTLKRYPADLYIGHNLGALSAVVEAAKRHGAACGFDAEDFHRCEISDDTDSLHYRLCKFLEDACLKKVDYLSASSPLIAERYAAIYQREVPALLNVFERPAGRPSFQHGEGPLKLFWFSQTLGSNRGLETIINAVTRSGVPAELHLIGMVAPEYRQALVELAQENGRCQALLFFYQPVKAAELFTFALQMEIGIASETGFCLNNQLALSNKLFTYLQSGLAVIASNTAAQYQFMSETPGIGSLYETPEQLAEILKCYYRDREVLLRTRQRAYEAGQTRFNWDTEAEKFARLAGAAIKTGSH